MSTTIDLGYVVGPSGATGPTGPTGPIGNTGPSGPTLPGSVLLSSQPLYALDLDDGTPITPYSYITNRQISSAADVQIGDIVVFENGKGAWCTVLSPHYGSGMMKVSKPIQDFNLNLTALSEDVTDLSNKLDSILGDDGILDADDIQRGVLKASMGGTGSSLSKPGFMYLSDTTSPETTQTTGSNYGAAYFGTDSLDTMIMSPRCGTLPLWYGGTGATTKYQAQTNLDIQPIEMYRKSISVTASQFTSQAVDKKLTLDLNFEWEHPVSAAPFVIPVMVSSVISAEYASNLSISVYDITTKKCTILIYNNNPSFHSGCTYYIYAFAPRDITP